ncbi:hypothetical protein JZ751_028435 [Albula glossodonta]|uniref:Uncharacterized protein n=1 Tax=Albula glossodonta TaxID=121402 RepID=A0A8T2NC72_9TELE|nr:hypothetical protein JZ751_028435 [Albula glossodonta]
MLRGDGRDQEAEGSRGRAVVGEGLCGQETEGERGLPQPEWGVTASHSTGAGTATPSPSSEASGEVSSLGFRGWRRERVERRVFGQENTTHLSWQSPTSTGGRGRGGRVEVLIGGGWQAGLRAGGPAGDLGREDEEEKGARCMAGGWFSSGRGGGGCSKAAGEGGRGGGNCLVAAEPGAEAGPGPPQVEQALCPRAPGLAWEAVRQGVWLEFSGRRDEDGDRLGGRLLWEPPPPPPPVDECFLPRERDEGRRDEVLEKGAGERLRERTDRLQRMAKALLEGSPPVVVAVLYLLTKAPASRAGLEDLRWLFSPRSLWEELRPSPRPSRRGCLSLRDLPERLLSLLRDEEEEAVLLTLASGCTCTGLAAGGSEKVSESELMSSYSTSGLMALTAGGAAESWTGKACPSDDASRPCLDDLCRLRLDEEDLDWSLPSLLVMLPTEECAESRGWYAPLLPLAVCGCSEMLALGSGFLLVPWCRSDPGIPHVSSGPSPKGGPL